MPSVVLKPILRHLCLESPMNIAVRLLLPMKFGSETSTSAVSPQTTQALKAPIKSCSRCSCMLAPVRIGPSTKNKALAHSPRLMILAVCTLTWYWLSSSGHHSTAGGIGKVRKLRYKRPRGASATGSVWPARYMISSTTGPSLCKSSGGQCHGDCPGAQSGSATITCGRGQLTSPAALDSIASSGSAFS
jgi:hypothetical protein